MASYPDHDFVVDDIVAKLDRPQLLKLSELQAKVDHVFNLPDFSSETLNDAKYQTTAETLPNGLATSVTFDAGVIKSKAFIKAVGETSPTQLRTGTWKNVKHDDPDTLMVRHLRARNFDVDKALTMMLESVRWRDEKGIHDPWLKGGDERLVSEAEHSAADSGASTESQEGRGADDSKTTREVLEQIRSGKSFTHGTDKAGRPLLYVRVKVHNPSAQSLEGLEKYIVYQAETARLILRPPQTAVAMIFDLGGFSMANMDWNAVKLLTLGLEDKLPESMSQLYIYRAPWIINGIWAVVKGWMPGEQANKVLFVKDAKQLSEHVDLDIIPEDMGGTAGYAYTFDEPVQGENKHMEDTATRDELQKRRDALIVDYENVTREWVVKIQDGDADDLMRKRRDLVTKMRDAYWKLDPYVRGRTVLDRTGRVPESQPPTSK